MRFTLGLAALVACASRVFADYTAVTADLTILQTDFTSFNTDFGTWDGTNLAFGVKYAWSIKTLLSDIDKATADVNATTTKFTAKQATAILTQLTTTEKSLKTTVDHLVTIHSNLKKSVGSGVAKTNIASFDKSFKGLKAALKLKSPSSSAVKKKAAAVWKKYQADISLAADVYASG